MRSATDEHINVGVRGDVRALVAFEIDDLEALLHHGIQDVPDSVAGDGFGGMLQSVVVGADEVFVLLEVERDDDAAGFRRIQHLDVVGAVVREGAAFDALLPVF